MSELRIALIMGGGVSLGSFSAGALARVLRLLEFVQRGPAKIDVVTGASAGSMTLAVMMYHMFRGSSLATMEAALRSAWIKRISFDELCPDLSTHDVPSLFSDRIIREIAGGEINFDTWTDDAPHPYFAEGAVASFALTNLNGIPVRAEGQLIRQSVTGGAAPGGASSAFADALQTTFHDDAMRFCFRRERADPAEDAKYQARSLVPWTTPEARREWASFREAAIASGAFPGAFPPVRLTRRRSEYPLWPDELDRPEFTFDFVDGGVLRNEPLREAVHLAAERDEDQDVERVFILIDPNVAGTREIYPLAFNQNSSLSSEVDDWGELLSSEVSSATYMTRLGGVLRRLIGVLASQATFRDWLKAARINSQIEWRDDLSSIIGQIQPIPGSDAEKRVDALIEKIYVDKVVRAFGIANDAVDMNRIRGRIIDDLNRRAQVGGAGEFAAKLNLLVDLVANLREKRKINMVAITPAATPDGDPLPIAGNFLSNFGGFFNEAYRAHDFAVGEYVTNAVLTATIPGAEPLLRADAPTLHRPEDLNPDPSFRNLSWEIQKKFEGLVADHVKSLAPMIGLPGPLHGLFADKIRGQVRSALVGAPIGSEAAFVVEISNVNDLFLRGSRTGKDLGEDGGRMRTVVVATKEGPLTRAKVSLAGPHLQSSPDNSESSLELRHRNRLRGSEKVSTIVFTGSPSEWFHRARFSAIPTLYVAMGDEPIVRARPDQLVDAASDRSEV